AKRDLITPVALAVVTRLGSIAILYAALRAVGGSAPAGVVVFAYCAGLLASIAVPVLQGAGAVESTVALGLTRGGVPAEVAIGTALLWRLLEFWIPLALGLLLQAGSDMRSRTVSAPPLVPQPVPVVTRATPVSGSPHHGRRIA